MPDGRKLFVVRAGLGCYRRETLDVTVLHIALVSGTRRTRARGTVSIKNAFASTAGVNSPTLNRPGDRTTHLCPRDYPPALEWSTVVFKNITTARETSCAERSDGIVLYCVVLRARDGVFDTTTSVPQSRTNPRKKSKKYSRNDRTDESNSRDGEKFDPTRPDGLNWRMLRTCCTRRNTGPRLRYNM